MKVPTTIKNLLPDYISALLIFLFIYTAASKILNIESFQHSLENSPLLKDYVFFISWFIPSIETSIALLLLFPASRLIGLYASFFLLLAFTGYVAYMIMFIPQLPCSCGGIIQKLSWNQHLVLNIFLTALTALGTKWRSHWHTGKPVKTAATSLG